VAQRQLGDSCRDAGDPTAARAACLEAVRLDRQLLVEHADDLEARGGLADSLDSLGQLEALAGHRDEAQSHFTEAIQLARQVCDESPDAPEGRSRLAASLNRLGELVGARQASQALVLHQQALKQLDLADTSRGPSRPFRREVARSYDLIAAAEARLERWDEARQAYEQAIALRQPMLDREPELTTVRRELAASCNNLGLVHARTGQPQPAQELFDRAIAVQLPLLSQTPDDLANRSSLASMYNNRGFVQEQLAEFAEALESYQLAVQHQREAYERGQNVVRYRERLSRHYFNYGRVLRQEGRFREAVETALARKMLWLGAPLRLESVATEIRQTADALEAANPLATTQVAEYRRLSADILEEARAARASAKAVESDPPDGDSALLNDLSPNLD
jgi:tetratricopeptide (TPR) repeat protein